MAYIPKSEAHRIKNREEGRPHIAIAKTDRWASPPHIIEAVEKEFGRISLDPAADAENAVAHRFFTKEEDGLTIPWRGDLIYVNPPYGRVLNEWIDHALKQYDEGYAKRIVMLLPSRTCTRWFHRLLNRSDVEIRFIKGRLKYGDGSGTAPFPSMLVIIGCDQQNLSTALEIMTEKQIAQYMEAIGVMPE
jgi:site-specific DNA-methyltransferase (adenine-specific)